MFHLFTMGNTIYFLTKLKRRLLVYVFKKFKHRIVPSTLYAYFNNLRVVKSAALNLNVRNLCTRH